MKVSLPEINKLAIPAIFAGIIEPLISITDTIIAGKINIIEHNNLPYLGAIGLAGALLSAFVWIFAQTRSAISSYVAISYGKKQIQAVRPLVSQTFYMNLILGITIAFLAYTFTEFIFTIQSAKGTILELTSDYFQIRVWGFPFTLLTFTLFGVFRGYQNTRWAMYIGLIGGLTNIILDLLFVYIFKWNIEGIAYASIIAQIIMFIGALYVLFDRTPFYLKWNPKIHPDFKGLIIMSINLIIRTLSLNIAIWFANKFATSYGEEYISTQSILIQIWLLSAFLLDGYSVAGNALSGMLKGQNDTKRLWILSQDLIKIMLICSLIIMLFMFIFYNPLGLLFTQDTTILTLFDDHFWMIILMQPICAIAFLFDGIFKGLGEAKELRNVLLIATFVGFLPTLYFMDSLGFKLYSIWIAFFVWMIIRSSVLFFKFKQKYNTI
ncbi:protein DETOXIFICATION [Flavobacteriaceae bacterium UJ101]|nr:protein DETOXIFICATION [Flavobacteriaceae bacterium UJ101]